MLACQQSFACDIVTKHQRSDVKAKPDQAFNRAAVLEWVRRPARRRWAWSFVRTTALPSCLVADDRASVESRVRLERAPLETARSLLARERDGRRELGAALFFAAEPDEQLAAASS